MNNFEWLCGSGEIHKSLMNLVKYNEGSWKSEKHGLFFIEKHAVRKTGEELKNNFGINERDSVLIATEAYMRYSHGARGMVPYTTYFIIDEIGVKAVYRLHYKGNMRDGCRPDTTKTECKFKRIGTCNHCFEATSDGENGTETLFCKLCGYETTARMTG
jgi:hypothetical protein